MESIEKNNTLSISFALSRGKLSDNGATPWYTSIGLGTPLQNLKWMIDTGTNNTWITGSDCTTNACIAHIPFDAAHSSSYHAINTKTICCSVGAHRFHYLPDALYTKPIDKDFGPWGSMLVYIGEDQFTFDINKQEKMKFQLSIHYTGCQFEALVCDGGIAIPGPFWQPEKNTQSLLLQCIKSGQITHSIASFYTPSDKLQGMCLFGAVDTSLYISETLQWLACKDVSKTGLGYLWAVELKQIQFDNIAVAVNISSFILDTGSSYFKGPKLLIEKLVSAATKKNTLPSYLSDPTKLKDYPDLTLQLGSRSYTLTPQEYFIQYNENYWEIGIQVLDGMPDGMLLVGSLFLDQIYSIFDIEQQRIGIAQLA